MILSDRDILQALEEKHYFIDPMPSHPKDFDTTSVNLHLGNEFRIWDHEVVKKGFGGQICIDLASFDFRTLATNYTKLLPTASDGSVILEPKQFILSITQEKVGNTDPSCCLAARVEGKSSLARLGLQVHMTAPIIHAGFFGNITLEMYNAGPFNIKLQPGVSICQLIVEKVSSAPACSMNGKQFQEQTSPVGASIG